MIDKELAYDKEIAPLMDKIIESCKRNEIPFFCDFQLTEIDEDEERSGLFCTSTIFDYVWADKDKFQKYLQIGKPKKQFAAFVIETNSK